MYNIYWMNQHNQGWTEDRVFLTEKMASENLKNQGYQLNGGWYTREAIGWEGKTRALVEKVNLVHSKKEKAPLTWKTKMGLSTAIQNQEVVRYLAELGFQESVFLPEFSNEETANNIEHLGNVCLRLKIEQPFGDVFHTIFINDQEIYVETSRKTFEQAKHLKLTEKLSMDTIDRILNKML